MNIIHITIDGPAGAGKSTIAKNIAEKLNILHLDTGAMYRAIGLHALNEGINMQSKKEVEDMLDDININVNFKNNRQQTILNEINVSSKIRSNEVSKAASSVSKFLCVRKKLVSMQQKIADSISIVMDGRDIGTHVLTNADYKFYLTASVKQRALRRYLELNNASDNISIDEIQKEIEARDYQDTHREFSPLQKADDELEIDTSKLSIEQVLNKIYKVIGIDYEDN